MTNIIQKVTNAYNAALSSIEREKKIQELTSSFRKQTNCNTKSS